MKALTRDSRVSHSHIGLPLYFLPTNQTTGVPRDWNYGHGYASRDWELCSILCIICDGNQRHVRRAHEFTTNFLNVGIMESLGQAIRKSGPRPGSTCVNTVSRLFPPSPSVSV